MNELRQCMGPECVQAARINSKYCSDACGIRLATNRIFQFLPPRLREWQSTPCVADQLNWKEVKKIEAELNVAENQLLELDEMHKKLEMAISQSKLAKVDPDSEEPTENAVDESESVCCVICGLEVNAKSALRHMDKCFSKQECQTSFGSEVSSNIKGLFCDAFNESTGLYCKRLKSICPEHSKEPKILPSDVCGCPLVNDFFKEEAKGLCLLPKLSCYKHYRWERMFAAEIDLRRLRLWLKVEDLYNRKKQLKLAMSRRAGLLGLLLHQVTYNGDVSAKNT